MTAKKIRAITSAAIDPATVAAIVAVIDKTMERERARLIALSE